MKTLCIILSCLSLIKQEAFITNATNKKRAVFQDQNTMNNTVNNSVNNIVIWI